MMRRLWHGSEELINDLRDAYGDAKGLAEASGHCQSTCQKFLNYGSITWEVAASMAGISNVAGPCLFDQDGEPEF